MPPRDLIWRKTPFPWQVPDRRLFSDPLQVAALVLLTWVLVRPYLSWLWGNLVPASWQSLLAVGLAGTVYHAFSLRFGRGWPSYVGFTAVVLGICGAFALAPADVLPAWFLPVFLCAAALYGEGLRQGVARLLPVSQARHILVPLTILRSVGLWLVVLTGYIGVNLRGVPPLAWVPLLVYSGSVAASLAWQQHRRHLLVAAFFILWQLVTLLVTDWYTSTPLLFLAVLGGCTVVQRRVEPWRFQLCTPLLWVMVGCLLSFTLLSFSPVLWPLALWSLVSFLAGRLLKFSPLWLWGVVWLYLLGLPHLEPLSTAYVALHPVSLAILSLLLVGLSVLTARRTGLFGPAMEYSWEKIPWLAPPELLARVAQGLVVLTLVQALATSTYRHTWAALLSMFLATLPAMLMAGRLGLSRRVSGGLPYTLAWIGTLSALPVLWPPSAFLSALPTFHGIGGGLLISLVTAVGSERLIPSQAVSYQHLKKITASVLLGIGLFTYLSTRQMVSTPWLTLLSTTVLSGSAALFFRYGVARDRWSYSGFVGGLTVSLLGVGALLLQHVMGRSLGVLAAYWLVAVLPAWFYGRSAYLQAQGRTVPGVYYAALVSLYGLLLLYIFPPLFRLLLLPAYPTGTTHYHRNALVALLASVALLRLYAIRGNRGRLFVGVTVGIAALDLLVTAVPLWSLTAAPLYAACVVILLSIGMLVTLHTENPVVTWLMRFANIAAEHWRPLQRWLVWYLLGGCHILAFSAVGATGVQASTGLLWLLLAGLWLVVGHYYRTAVAYYFAYAGVVGAIACVRLVGTAWSAPLTPWLYLLLFVALMPIYQRYLQARLPHALRYLYVTATGSGALLVYDFLTLAAGQSQASFPALLLLVVAAFGLPLPREARQRTGVTALLGLFTYAPVPLVLVWPGATAFDRLLYATGLAVGISCVQQLYQAWEQQWLQFPVRQEHRILHHLHWFFTQPRAVFPRVMQLAATGNVLVSYTVPMLGEPSALLVSKVATVAVLQAALTVSCFLRARADQVWWWTVAAKAMFFGLIATCRQTFPVYLALSWTPNWDVVAGLLSACAMTALRPLLRPEDKAVRVPVRFVLFGLPIATVLYAWEYQVDAAVLARVILLYAVLFVWQAYSEKDRLILAYAFLGFNTYLVMVLLQQHIESLQAYVTPVGVSLLILVQIFRDLTSRGTANVVRGAVLLALLGSALLQAMLDNAFSPLSHVFLLVLSVLSLAAAGFLRVRIFASAGLFGLLLDLIAIFYLVLSRQEAASLKVILGLGLTIGGGSILTGYLLYQRYKPQVDAWIRRWQQTFTTWE